MTNFREPVDPSRPLKNTRWERMALHVANGGEMRDACVEQGYKNPRSDASRFMKPDHPVRLRLDFLRDATAEKVMQAAQATGVTMNDIIRQLDEDREMAREKGQASAMVSATMGKAKVLGLVVDKSEHAMKKIDDMTEDELRALVGQGDDATRH